MKQLITVLLFFTIAIHGQGTNNIFVLSEGGFTAESATLSNLKPGTGEFAKNIFNPGSIGLYPDGLILYQDKLYLVEQGNFGGSGKLYELDTLGTVLKSKVVGTNPYSLAVSNGKVYLTNGPASNVSVLNVIDFSFVKTIDVGVYPQEIIAFGNKVFVANNSTWGGSSDSTVSVINSETDLVVSTITVRRDPSALAITNDNYLLVGCPGDSESGIIYKVDLDTYTKIDSLSIPDYGFGKEISVDKKSNKIFFKSQTNSIVEYDLISRESNAVVNDASIIYVYGYGYDYVNQTHYVLDAKDFSTNGSLKLYNSSGTQTDSYETGIAPRRVVFWYSDFATSIEDVKPVANFSLEQNYPNPFNPTTIIKFSLPNQTKVKLSIINSIGQEIEVLVDNAIGAGSHEVEFNGSSLSSGMYFYRLESGNFSSTKKMILLK